MPTYSNPQTTEHSKALYPTRSSDRALRSGVTDLSVRHRGVAIDEACQVRTYFLTAITANEFLNRRPKAV